MATLPSAGELDRRVTIKAWADQANAAFGLDQGFTDPIKRWARIRPAGAMVHYGSKQTGEGVTHYIVMRRDSQTLPELMTPERVIEHQGQRYRILRAVDLEGRRLFTSVECTNLGAIT